MGELLVALVIRQSTGTRERFMQPTDESRIKINGKPSPNPPLPSSAFNPCFLRGSQSSSWQCEVVALRIELSAVRLSAAPGQPALNDHGQISRDGRTRTDASVYPKHVGWPLPYIPKFSTPSGTRTPIRGSKLRHPEPLDERGVLVVSVEFPKPVTYPPDQQKTRRRVRHRVAEDPEGFQPCVTSAKRSSGAVSPTARQSALRISVGCWRKTTKSSWQKS